MRNRPLGVMCVVLSLGLLIDVDARADLFTYALNAPTGYGGGTVSGSITFPGNAGDPVPALSAATSFALSFVPSSGPTQTWSQTDSIGVSYNPAIDFGSGLLGNSTLTAVTIPSGLDYWAVTNAGLTTLDLYWNPSPYGPNWEVKNPNPMDYVYGTWTLTLQSDVPTPEPHMAIVAAMLVVLMSLWRRPRSLAPA